MYARAGKSFALQAFSRFLADYNRKYCALFNQGNAVFEDLIQKIKYRLLHGKCARTVFTHELLTYQKSNE